MVLQLIWLFLSLMQFDKTFLDNLDFPREEAVSLALTASDFNQFF